MTVEWKVPDSARRIRDEVFAAPNLIGVFAGHEHVLQYATAESGAVQIVCPKNGRGAQRLEIALLPEAPPEPEPRVLPEPPPWRASPRPSERSP